MKLIKQWPQNRIHPIYYWHSQEFKGEDCSALKLCLGLSSWQQNRFFLLSRGKKRFAFSRQKRKQNAGIESRRRKKCLVQQSVLINGLFPLYRQTQQFDYCKYKRKINQPYQNKTRCSLLCRICHHKYLLGNVMVTLISGVVYFH